MMEKIWKFYAAAAAVEHDDDVANHTIELMVVVAGHEAKNLNKKL